MRFFVIFYAHFCGDELGGRTAESDFEFPAKIAAMAK